MNFLLHSSLSCDIKYLIHTSWSCAHKGQNGPPCFEMILVDAPPAEHQPEKRADSSGPTYHSRTRAFLILSIRITMHRVCRRCFRNLITMQTIPPALGLPLSTQRSPGLQQIALWPRPGTSQHCRLCCFLVTHSAVPTTQGHLPKEHNGQQPASPPVQLLFPEQGLHTEITWGGGYLSTLDHSPDQLPWARWAEQPLGVQFAQAMLTRRSCLLRNGLPDQACSLSVLSTLFLHTVCGPCNLPHRDGAVSLLFTHVSFHSCAIKPLLPSVRPHQALVTPHTEPKPSLHAAEKLKCGSMHHPPSHPPSSTPSLTRQKAPYCLIPGPDEDCEETEWLGNQQASLPVFQKDQLHLSLSPQGTPDAWISGLMGEHT